jgi:Tol biopolymer transport system component
MKRQTIFIILMFVFVLTVSGTASATEKVSTNNTSVSGNDNSGNGLHSGSISADGTYVVFASDATNLVTDDTNGLSDIFVKNTKTKSTERVSFNKNGTQITTGTGSFNPVISADGRYVAYQSNGNLGWTASGNSEIYLYDRTSKSTELISKSTSLNWGTGNSYNPSISADGRYVAFDSAATNLADPNYEFGGTDANGVSDIFVRDRVTGVTKRVSLSSSDGQTIGSDSTHPSISADGRYVAFQSKATNLVSGVTDPNGYNYIYVRDIWGGTTQIATWKFWGQYVQPNNNCANPSISADGHYVVFESDATNLNYFSGDTNGKTDIFRANMFQAGAPTINLVSCATNGAQGNNWASTASISADGRYVSFTSWASNLVSGDNAWNNIFVKNMATGKIKRLSVSSNGIAGNSYSFNTAISADGRYVVFDSLASNLVPDTNGKTDIFMNTVDFNSPVVTAVSPKNGSKNVKRSKTITITFSKNIKISNASKIVLKNSKGKVIATGKTIISNKLILTHGKLTANTKYYIYINAGAIADYTDNPNLNTINYKYYFKTGKY